VHVANSTEFDWIYLAGSGTTGSYCGEPDLSVITNAEMAEVGRMIVQACEGTPVIADADTGFGGPLNISRTIAMCEAGGIAGCHIEDQTFPKRCGQLDVTPNILIS
jgi:2-methylisocitrate lyase-like PEP mutase family enzyme